MLLLKLFLIFLALGGAWRLLACAYAGRAAWWFAILYSLFYIAVIGVTWYYLPALHTPTQFILLFIFLILLYIPILGCFTKGWRERQEEAGQSSGPESGFSYEKTDHPSDHSGDSGSSDGGDGGGGD